MRPSRVTTARGWAGAARALTLASVGLWSALLAVPACGQLTGARTLDLSEPITYYIGEASPDLGVTERDRTMALWALEAWGSLADPAVRFVPAHVRQTNGVDSATLVRGSDAHGHLLPEEPPVSPRDPGTLARYEAAMARRRWWR